MRQTALQYFDDRERLVANEYLRQAAAWFREASGRFANPREEQPEVGAEGQREALSKALEELRRRPSIRLRRGDGVRIELRPGIEGREVVLRETLVAPGQDGVDFLANVNLTRLLEMAEHHTQVPDLFEAYNRICAPVSLPDFLTALSALVAKRFLIDAR